MENTRRYILERGIVKEKGGWRFPVAYREVSYLSDISNYDSAKSFRTQPQTLMFWSRK